MYKVGIYTVFPQLPLKLIAAEACGEAERDRLHSELSQHERNIYPLAPAAAALVQTAVDRTGPQLGHIHGVVKARIEGQCVYHSFSPCGEISLLAHRLNRYAVIGCAACRAVVGRCLYCRNDITSAGESQILRQ